MSEFAFELALCAHFERERDAIVSRQLGTAIHDRRILDTLLVEPGPGFDERAAITSERIPLPAIESDVGPGSARFWKDAFDCHPDRARSLVEWAVDVGFFERERRSGRTYVRQTTRYPDDWFDRIVGIENKPDLGRPGALETQLLTDVTLALVDEVVLATESHVTGAHLNRIPEAVGVWRFDPESGERTVIREAEPLPTDEAGIEIVERTSARTEIRVATAAEKARARCRVAERAYGKGWRTFDFPDCARVAPDDDGLPYCPYKERVVRPATDCGPACGGHDPTDAPDQNIDGLRAARTPWEPDPAGRKRRQSGLDRYVDD
ncbi:DUF5787 family protein [Salinibaculum salinum]|uniref:DUF5787 family protein n=1 Tax=Salinibaculum salinum TaxID=3131996 RepID=UPI0030EE0206